MAYDKVEQKHIFKKTKGHCNICRKLLIFNNYGANSTVDGVWEVDHDNPKSKDGSDKISNLFPTCVSCNRKKQDKSTEDIRELFSVR